MDERKFVMGKFFTSPWVGEAGFIGHLPMEVDRDFFDDFKEVDQNADEDCVSKTPRKRRKKVRLEAD